LWITDRAGRSTAAGPPDFRKAILHWDNKKVDLSLVTNTTATIEATGKATAYMPMPAEIDQCVEAAVPINPKLRETNGEINMFTVLECTTKAEV